MNRRSASKSSSVDGFFCDPHTPAPKIILRRRDTNGMLDRDIRPTLLRTVREGHPGVSLFEEFPVCRKGRADVVAVNAALWGYEIKSERDSLNRLPIQIERYECVFDFCVIVAAERHLKHAEKLVPDHWGVYSVGGTPGDCSIVEVRQPQRNPHRQVEQIIRILWKTEGIRALRNRGIAVPSSASVRKIWNMLGELPLSDLEELVRSALKFRCASESDQPQTSDDDLRTTEAIASCHPS